MRRAAFLVLLALASLGVPAVLYAGVVGLDLCALALCQWVGEQEVVESPGRGKREQPPQAADARAHRPGASRGAAAAAAPNASEQRDAGGDPPEPGAGVYPGGAKVVVVITPTFKRNVTSCPPQANVLLRVRNAFCMSRQRVVWVLVSDRKSPQLARVPECRSDNPGRFHAVHLVATPSPPPVKITKSGKTRIVTSPHRGVEQRNAALDFVQSWKFRREVRRAGFDPEPNPVIFFGDDDNEYTPDLFDELAKVRKIGVWPVGFPFGVWEVHPQTVVETVSVSPENGSFLGYSSSFCGRRFFSLDMAAFGLRLDILGQARFDLNATVGHLESMFLEDIEYLTGPERFEILAAGATRVNVWHMRWKCELDPNQNPFKDLWWELVAEVRQPAPIWCNVTQRERKPKSPTRSTRSTTTSRPDATTAADARLRRHTTEAAAVETRVGGGELPPLRPPRGWGGPQEAAAK